jgi:hypothetical protein
MSKSAIDDITTRKLTMILHARNHVDASKDKSSARPQHAVSHEDALRTEMLVNQALIDLLVAKGVFSREELLERIEAIRKARECC